MTYKREFTVNEKRLSLFTLAHELEKCAGDHAASLGVSSARLLEDDILWVLVKREVIINRLPEMGEKVIAETWPGKSRHGFYPRRFRFYDEKGELLLMAACKWVLMDAKTRELADHEAVRSLSPEKLENEQKLPASKVAFPEMDFVCEKTVTEDEIDMNGHLNNAYYLGWAEELLPEGFVPSEIWIEYLRELFVGEKIRLERKFEDGAWYIRGMCGDEVTFGTRIKK